MRLWDFYVPNLTSQLLVNVYMNEFDRYVKHNLREKYYIRYADDFVLFNANRRQLEILIPQIGNFLDRALKLSLHPRKVSIGTWASGVDFLGWICFPDHRVLRTATKRRALKRVIADPNLPRVASYLGMLRHGNAKGIERKIREIVENNKTPD